MEAIKAKLRTENGGREYIHTLTDVSQPHTQAILLSARATHAWSTHKVNAVRLKHFKISEHTLAEAHISGHLDFAKYVFYQLKSDTVS